MNVFTTPIERLSLIYAKDDEDGWMQIAPIWNNPLEGRKLGLPTFPISDGMTVHERDPFALQWLIDHGTFQSDIRYYKKIIKISATHYKLTCNSGSDDDEITLANAPDLAKLLEMQSIDIRYWYWYSNL